MAFIRAIYILALGLVVALFFTFGIAAFYPEPKGQPSYPEPPLKVRLAPPQPVPPQPVGEDYYQSEEYKQYQAQVQEYEKQQQEFQKQRDRYRQRVFYIASALGLATVFLSVGLSRRLEGLWPGILIGGLATIIYAMAQRGLAIGLVARFGVITLVLAALVYLGWQRMRREP